jgi:hypothetical protein
LPIPGSARKSHAAPRRFGLDVLQQRLEVRECSSRPTSGFSVAASRRSERSFHTAISCAKPRIGMVAT